MRGGGGGGGAQTVMNTNVPAEVMPIYRSAIERANAVSNREYTPYAGQRIAEFSPLQQQAQARASGLDVPRQIGTASNMVTQAGQAGVGTQRFIDPGVAGAYMNPYTEQVVSRNLREAERGFNIGEMNRTADTIKRGGLGGYRDQLLRSEARRNQDMRLDDIANTGYAAAFDNAGRMFTSDAGRQLQADMGTMQGRIQAGQTLGGLGRMELDAQRGVIDMQNQIGSQQQQQVQRGLTQSYQDFLDQRNWDWGQLANLRNIISGVNTGSTSTTTSQAGNPMAQAIGTGLSALAAYNLGQG
jgi:hypothetical protein